jgi:uracil-DNA glycosylase
VGAVPGASIYLVGQAPGPREVKLERPFAWTAGRTMFGWFATLGVDEATFRSRVYMAAVISCFPGRLPGKTGDRRPSRQEVETCRVHRETELELLRPALVLPVGRMAIELFMPCPSLEAVVGRQFRGAPNGHACDVIPLPHPSGLSRWIQTPQGKTSIRQALALIGAHPAWQRTFPEAEPAALD